MNFHEELLFISESDVRTLLTPEDAIAAAEDAFLQLGLGQITVEEMALLHTDASCKNNFHSMPAILHHKELAGMKWISTYSNPLPGYPFSHGNLIILSDIRTGSPLAIVGATHITAMRTAGGHGVVQAKHLCKKEPKVLSVFGCGLQGKAGIHGFLTQFPSLRTIRLYSRSTAPMEQIRRELEGRVEVVLCGTPQQALDGSELVLMASGARQPLITADMLRPGMTVIGMEGFRDLDPQISKVADKWFMGYRKADERILESPVLNPDGFLEEKNVYGDMTQLLTGSIAGRESDGEILISTHMGMGAHDVNCAAVVYQRAVEQGMGQKLRLS